MWYSAGSHILSGRDFRAVVLESEDILIVMVGQGGNLEAVREAANEMTSGTTKMLVIFCSAGGICRKIG